METFELRYFAAVARHENIHRAAEEIAVSPASLSKAVARLEDELGVQLFERVRRNIHLTSHGRILQRRAAEILGLEEAARIELKGHAAGFQVRVVGPEALLAKVAPELIKSVHASHPLATFELAVAADDEATHRVALGEAHLGLTTVAVPAGLTAKTLFDTTFQTCVGRGHPLYRAAHAGRSVPVAEVLTHPFVSPDRPVLGETAAAQSPDGWRDDKFPRRIGFVTTSLQMIEELVTSGRAVAYLPDYYVEQIPVVALKITGCPYTCKQTVRLACRRPDAAGWLRQLF